MTDENKDLIAPKRKNTVPPHDDFDEPKKPFKLPRPIKWIGIGVVGIFGLLIVAGLAIPLFVDFNALRDKAIQEVKAQTGFTISLSEKIGFTVMPFPKVTVYDVTVRHPSDDPSNPLLQAKEINVSVGLASILAGKIDIPEVNIKDGAAHLHAYANGTNNWTPVAKAAASDEAQVASAQTSDNPAVGAAQAVTVNADVAAQGIEAPKDESAAAKAPPAFSLDTIKLSDINVVYTGADGKPNDIAVKDGKVGLSGFDGPFSIDLDGKAYQGRLPIDLSANIGEMKKGDAKPVPVKIDFKTDHGKVNLNGEALLGDAMQYKGKADIDFDNLTAVLQAMDPKAAAAPVTKFALKSDDITASTTAVDVDNAQVVVDEAKGPVTLKLQGLGSDALAGDVIADLDTNGWKLAQGFKKVKVSGKFSRSGDVTRIDPLDLTLDGQNIKGAVAMNKAGTAVNLTSDRLDLAPLLEKFNIKDVPIKTLNGLAVNGQIQGNALTLTSLTVNDVNGMKLAAFGGLKNMQTGEGAVLKATASSANVLKSLQQFPQVTIPKEAEEFLNGPGGASVDFAGNFAQGNLTAKINAMNGSAGIKTTVSDIQKAPKLGAMTFVINHPNTNALLGMLSPGTKLGPAFNGPMQAEAAVAQDGKNWKVSNLKAHLGGTDVAGNLTIGTGDVASISGNLTTGAIDLGQWFAAKESGPKTSSREDGASPLLIKAATGGITASGKWSTAPIDVTWMRKTALDLNLKASSLKSDPWVVSNPTLKINLSNGSLKLSDVSGGFQGGTLNGNATVDADANGSLTMKGDMKAANINLDTFTRALAKTDQVVEGTGALDLNVNSHGASPNALINALGGSGTLSGKSLIVHGVNVDAMVDAVNAVEDDNWTSALQLTGSNYRNGASRFGDASIPLTIANGVLTWPETKLTSDRSTIYTQGRLDFPAWLINVANKVQINTKEGRNIDALQITTTGSLDNPQTKTDSSAITNKLKSRAGKLIDKKLGDKLPTGVKDALGSFLGTTPKATETAPAAATETAPTTTAAPVYNAPAATTATATTTAPAATETAPAQQAAPVEAQPEQTPEQQIINGVLNKVMKQ